jgi:D-alanine-D-alanine ligase
MTRSLADLHVAVLMGGLSSEREVSLSSGKECADALEGQVARVTRVDAGRDIAQVLTALKPDVVLNALHGEWGEDGCVQGILETLQIPYTHSGVLASAITMDKDKTKSILRAAGVVVPGGGLFDRFEVARRHVIPPPYIIKPNAEGSSVGVYLVPEGANGPQAAVGSPDWTYGDLVMVEPYIPGRELAVAVIGEASGPRPDGHRHHPGQGLLRLRGQIRARRLGAQTSGRPAGRRVRGRAARIRAGAYGAGLPRGVAFGLSL